MPKSGYGQPPPSHKPAARGPARIVIQHDEIRPPPEPCGHSCAACGTVLCPLCAEEARRLLDLASEGSWKEVEAVLAVRPEMLNYQPDRGERSNAGPRRRNFSLLHWAAHDGDEDRLFKLLALPGCQQAVRTREGKSASTVALEARNYAAAALLHAFEKGLIAEHIVTPSAPPPTPEEQRSIHTSAMQSRRAEDVHIVGAGSIKKVGS
eukprot:scaffold224437_cov33-Tisochrysis_lutea.AAC.1